MSSIFSNLPLWKGDHCYVTAHADFLHHQIDPAHLNVGTTCLMTCSSSLFRRLLELFPPVDDGTLWPYSTTPLRVCQTGTGKRFAVHFLRLEGRVLPIRWNNWRRAAFVACLALGSGELLKTMCKSAISSSSKEQCSAIIKTTVSRERVAPFPTW
jgi:hypothetical protein